MASKLSTPRRRGTPLRPLTPFGEDPPEDTPSKIRARHAAELASVRKRLEKEATQSELQAGVDRHEQLVTERSKKTEEAKTDAALRRERLDRITADKAKARKLEAERRREEAQRASEERKVNEEFRDKRKAELEKEKRQQMERRVEEAARVKQMKRADELSRRASAAEDYAAGIAEMRRREAEEKAIKQSLVESRREGLENVRALKAAARQATLKAQREEMEFSRENARLRDEEKKKEAEARKQALRDRASDYRMNKELAKTSAFAR